MSYILNKSTISITSIWNKFVFIVQFSSYYSWDCRYKNMICNMPLFELYSKLVVWMLRNVFRVHLPVLILCSCLILQNCTLFEQLLVCRMKQPRCTQSIADLVWLFFLLLCMHNKPSALIVIVSVSIISVNNLRSNTFTSFVPKLGFHVEWQMSHFGY